MTDTASKGEIVIYTDESGQVSFEAKLENETIWLTQDMMAKLFETTSQNITMHIKNIYAEEELEQSSTCKDFLQVRKEGSRDVSRKLAFYNLDMILSVGYRIKSKTAIQFRKWATNTIYQYELEKIKNTYLNESIDIVQRSIEYQVETLDEAKDVARLLDNFAGGLDMLDNYDHKKLDTRGKSQKESVVISEKEFLAVIDKMKSEFATDVFATPKDNSFSSSVNQIYQTFEGKELYPTLEEKAATLLYLIVKNHSFADGNKRIGASCFLYFMDKNNMLYENGRPIIDNSTLAALTLLIATSKPEEMETVKQIVLSVLNKGGANG